MRKAVKPSVLAVDAIERARWAPPSGENRPRRHDDPAEPQMPLCELGRLPFWGVPLKTFVHKTATKSCSTTK